MTQIRFMTTLAPQLYGVTDSFGIMAMIKQNGQDHKAVPQINAKQRDGSGNDPGVVR